MITIEVSISKEKKTDQNIHAVRMAVQFLLRRWRFDGRLQIFCPEHPCLSPDTWHIEVTLLVLAGNARISSGHIPASRAFNSEWTRSRGLNRSTAKVFWEIDLQQPPSDLTDRSGSLSPSVVMTDEIECTV